ncbi:MAG: SAM-dependent methyltransferase, partial [Piscirickettsiaceae bacterium]
MKDYEKKESLTIGHYENNAKAFWTGTKDHDVSQNTQAFLAALPNDKALNILDLGCGPGRDLHYFKSLGHNPTGLDGSREFCNMATEYSGCPTINQTFVTMDLPADHFDGIFANATLFHVPFTELLDVLKKLYQSLRTDGILFTSNPRGNGESWSGQRYGHYLELEPSKKILEEA